MRELNLFALNWFVAYGVVWLKRVPAREHGSKPINDALGEAVKGVAVEACSQIKSASATNPFLEIYARIDLEGDRQYSLGVSAVSGA
ncbi:hypothetical protein D3C75_1250570 [compost metagenome]